MKIDMCNTCLQNFLNVAQHVKGEIALHDAIRPASTVLADVAELCQLWDGAGTPEALHDAAEQLRIFANGLREVQLERTSSGEPPYEGRTEQAEWFDILASGLEQTSFEMQGLIDNVGGAEKADL